MDRPNADLIMCEQCGEVEATAHLAEASLCDTCFEWSMKEALEDVFSYVPCCALTWVNGQPRLCLVPSGTEHDHA